MLCETLSWAQVLTVPVDVTGAAQSIAMSYQTTFSSRSPIVPLGTCLGTNVFHVGNVGLSTRGQYGTIDEVQLQQACRPTKSSSALSLGKILQPPARPPLISLWLTDLQIQPLGFRLVQVTLD